MKVLRILLILLALISFATAASAFDVAPMDMCQGWFPDVGASDPFCKWIEKFAELGVTTGYADGTYRSGVSVTRGQMAAFIMRALQLFSGNDNSSLWVEPVFLESAQTGIYYNRTVTMTATGMTSPSYTCSIISGVAGITATATGNICTIQGTSTTPGQVIIKFTASDASGHVDRRLRVFSVADPSPLSLNLNPASLPNGTQNSSYYQTVAMSASGGTSPYGFSCWGSGVSGLFASPSGSNCLINGTPTATGTYTATFHVTDSASPAATDQKQIAFSVTPYGEPAHDHLTYYVSKQFTIEARTTKFFEATLPSACSTSSGQLRFKLTMQDQANIDMLVKKSYGETLPWPTFTDYTTKLAQYPYDSQPYTYTDGTLFWNFISSLGGETVTVYKTYTEYPGFNQADTYYILVYNTDNVTRYPYIIFQCY